MTLEAWLGLKRAGRQGDTKEEEGNPREKEEVGGEVKRGEKGGEMGIFIGRKYPPAQGHWPLSLTTKSMGC